MAILKCKMCGGDLIITEGLSTCECEYCGSTQTVPNADNEKKLTLFGRANRLRMACEFDKASGVYESIIQLLPPRQLDAIKLIYAMGFSYKEAADAMGITENAVASLISRGKENLKKIMGDKLYEYLG